MYCPRCQATITKDCCINRQLLAEKKAYEYSINESLLHCIKCPTGKDVRDNPKKYSDADVEFILKKMQHRFSTENKRFKRKVKNEIKKEVPKKKFKYKKKNNGNRR